MRLRRKEPQSEVFERRIKRLEKAYGERRMQQLESDLKAAMQRVDQLEAEQHGHCDSCGKQTEFPTMNWCQKNSCHGDAA